MRTRMAELFGDETCVRWWLPDDEGFTPILRSLRHFADERSAIALTAQSERLRDVQHILDTMCLDALGGSSPAGDRSEQSKGKEKTTAGWTT